MNLRNISLSLLACSGSALAVTLPSFTLQPQQKAVKVEIPSSGLYEISYDKLRELGFENPEKVGVAGFGGEMMPMDFADDSGNDLLSETPRPVNVIHKDGKILFYATGTSRFSLNPDENAFMEARVKLDEVNLFSRNSIYILTDADWAFSKMPERKEPDAPSGDILNSGIGFVCHDIDLEHNSTMSGRVFWGERFNAGFPSKQTWVADAKGAVADSEASLECVFYAVNSASGSVTFGIEGAAPSGLIKHSKSKSTVMTTRRGVVSKLPMSSSNPQIFVEYASSDNVMDYANLDYWLLSYTKSTESIFKFEDDTPQNTIAYGRITSPAVISAPESDSVLVLDISDEGDPAIVSPVSVEGKKVISVPSSMSRYLTADLSRPQLSPASYSAVSGSDVRERLSAGADMLIITTGSLVGPAKALAQLHEQNDGMKVVVATVDELYTEFSSCMPSPMAYRCAARMLYDNEQRPLRNILLFGPLSSDIRGIQGRDDVSETIIAYQAAEITEEKGAMNINHILGMISDRVSVDQVHITPMQVGIGILPVMSPSEGFSIVDKIRSYMTDNKHAATLNEFLCIGGVGDSHTHDKQAEKVANQISELLGGSAISSLLPVDAYGNESARQQLINYLNAGKNIVLYIGHGGTTMLGKNLNFFITGDIEKLSNNSFPFMIFAGCDITNFDRGQRGIGEEMVMTPKNGIIGSLLSNRSSWSGQNMDMVTDFFNTLFDPNMRDENGLPPTIGQVYAKIMTNSSYKNELAYHILGDPALRITVPYHRIQATAPQIAPGSNVKFSGIVTDADGNSATGFSGDAVIKITSPAVRLLSADLESGLPSDPKLQFTPVYDDNVVAIGSGIVTDGKLEAEIFIPSEISQWVGQEMKLHISSYDAATGFAATGGFSFNATIPDETSGSAADTEAPVLESLVYDPLTATLDVVASDNVALSFARNATPTAFEVFVDGNPLINDSQNTPHPVAGFGSRKVKRSVMLPSLADGEHFATVKVADAAGNIATGEVSFRLGDEAPALNLVMLQKAVTETASFSIEGADFNGALLNIQDSEGKTVYSASLDSNSIEWKRIDNEGNRVSSGLYRAFVLKKGGNSSNAASNVIEVPVI